MIIRAGYDSISSSLTDSHKLRNHARLSDHLPWVQNGSLGTLRPLSMGSKWKKKTHIISRIRADVSTVKKPNVFILVGSPSIQIITDDYYKWLGTASILYPWVFLCIGAPQWWTASLRSWPPSVWGRGGVGRSQERGRWDPSGGAGRGRPHSSPTSRSR